MVVEFELSSSFIVTARGRPTLGETHMSMITLSFSRHTPGRSRGRRAGVPEPRRVSYDGSVGGGRQRKVAEDTGRPGACNHPRGPKLGAAWMVASTRPDQ